MCVCLLLALVMFKCVYLTTCCVPVDAMFGLMCWALFALHLLAVQSPVGCMWLFVSSADRSGGGL